MKNKIGLYIHIPFCESICPYCDFSHYISKYFKKEEYIKRLLEDLKAYPFDYFKSIYIGGGTPSCLNEEELNLLFLGLKKYVSENCSFTIECNPSSLTQEKIILFKKYGINRISLGIQSFQKRIQDKLERHCSFNEIDGLIKKIKAIGINDINVDLIYGVEDETLSELRQDLDLFTKLDITHISTYCLQVENHTLFYNKKIKEMNEDDASEEYKFICNYLRKKGFEHYEISNFAKEKYQSKHNLIYWRNEEYVGLGLSSSGYENNIRYKNTTSLNKYLDNDYIREEEFLSLKDKKEYFIILALRLKEGINFLKYKEIFNSDFKKEYKEVIDELVKNELIEIDEYHLNVKEEYFFTINQILTKFI